MRAASFKVLFLALSVPFIAACSAWGPQQAFEGPERSRNEVAIINGRSGLGFLESSIGIISINEHHLRGYDFSVPGPETAIALPGISKITVELLQYGISPGKRRSCGVTLLACVLLAGREYQLDYYRRSQATMEDRWKGRIGVTLKDVESGITVCEGSGLCLNF